jgi:hypothetical protein
MEIDGGYGDRRGIWRSTGDMEIDGGYGDEYRGDGFTGRVTHALSTCINTSALVNFADDLADFAESTS